MTEINRDGGSERPRRGSFGVAIRADVLRHEMRLRGLTGTALGRLTGLSNATISNALAGRRLHPSTFRRIAANLARVEVIPGAEALAQEERWPAGANLRGR
jgi:hypothetical protein